jgi:hydroxypyruvate isomerase
MAKLSVCIEPILEDIDFYERIPIIAELGFEAIEFWNPAGKDLSKIARLAAKNNLVVAGLNGAFPWLNRMNSDTGHLLSYIKEAMDYAKEVGGKSLTVLSGDVEGKTDSQKNILIENLKHIGELAVKENIYVNIEPLNTITDHKGYYLDSSYVAFEIIKCVNCSHIGVLYDIYHMQIMEGNIITNLTKNIDYIGHFHSAGVPGRHEHFDCEINYPSIIKAIDKTGYDKFVGLEYWPSYDNKKSLSDVRKYLLGL